MTETSVGKADSARLQTPAKLKKGTMRIVPLGGLGEVGRNMTVFELNGKLLIVDCGVLFPEEHQPGVDLILPPAFSCSGSPSPPAALPGTSRRGHSLHRPAALSPSGLGGAGWN